MSSRLHAAHYILFPHFLSPPGACLFFNFRNGCDVQWASTSALFANFMQPVAIIIPLWMANNIELDMRSVVLATMLLVYMCLTVAVVRKNGLTCVKPSSQTGHLHLHWWNWRGSEVRVLGMLYFAIVSLGFLFLIPNRRLAWFECLYFIITYMAARFTGQIHYKKNASIWCWVVASGPIATILFLKLFAE